ncbi:SDR family oxidoreductase [Sphingomonas ginkgonis]|uniref:SDR family oxidoreductase n=1 Tax=Sphingomonas ginkgonis TaxID=2315330 RepID=A0A429VE60_9SPHN|nr:SDR family oxidoreductase [Sphingomonas ginkgonis]
MSTNPNSSSFAVVTGGSNGIGLELARTVLENGFDVLIAAEDEGHLAQAKADLARGGGWVETFASDLSTEQGVDALCEAIGPGGVHAVRRGSMPGLEAIRPASTRETRWAGHSISR